MIRPLALILSMLPAAALAANWPSWRGPEFNGSSPETGLPEKFSKTENCRWTAAMPGPAASTPVIWEDRVFVSSTDEARQKLVGLCFDLKTGRLLWQNDIGDGFRQDERSNYAGPSPVTDGSRVIFFFGTGDLAAFTTDGTGLWKRNIQKDYGAFAFLWTFSSSPVLAWDTLYLQVLQRDTPVRERRQDSSGPKESFLLALDPATGAEKWRHVRPVESSGESHEAFSTPIPYSWNGRDELLVAGGDHLTGHDPKNGTELWRFGSWNPQRISHWRLVPSPVAGDGVILACAPKREPIYAVKAGASGQVGDDGLAWTSGDANSRHVSSDVSTPLFYRNRFYVLNSDRKSIFAIEPKTGREFWEHRLDDGAKIESSPTAADGKIFFIDHRGTVTVMAAGDEAKQLHSVALGSEGDQEVRSSIAIGGGCVLIRTNTTLYCMANP